MSIGCRTGIPADVAILLLQRFISFRELYLLGGSSAFIMCFLLIIAVLFLASCYAGAKGKLGTYASQQFINNWAVVIMAHCLYYICHLYISSMIYIKFIIRCSLFNY